MIRKLSVLAGVILVLGIGPALAANVFVGANSDGKSGEKPTIYNKVKPNAFSQKQKVVQYGARLNVKDLKAKSDMVAATLEEMQEMGFKPSTAEEMLLYANAHRAVHQSYMYERRQALIEHFEKQDIARVKRDILKNSSKAAFKVGGGSSGKASKSDDAKPSTTKKKTLSKRPVYLKKSADDKAKPTKVFTDY